MSEVGAISAMDNDGALHEASIRDATAAQQVDDMIAEYNAILESINSAGGGGGTDTPAPDVPSADTAIAAIDAAWNTDGIWATLAEYGDTVRKNPSAFSKYVGQTITYENVDFGTHQVRCVDICHFDRSDGTGKAAFCFDHVAILSNGVMNGSNTNSGGYPACNMKTVLESNNIGGYLHGMPDALKNAIVPVTIPCSLTSGATPADTPNCTLFLLSEKEVFGTSDYDNEGTQIAWYSANNNNSSRVKLYNGSSGNWWLRSPYSSTYFATVNNGGGLGGNGAGYARGVCPGFNIG